MTARVLVVDDIPSNIKLLEARLAAEYFDVDSASNGADALVRVTEKEPDIVLLDVMMPGMDGFEVCRRIKNNTRTAHIPVVMVTALDQTSDRVAGLDAGADDFLTKPVDDAALFARVRSLVRLKLLTDELRMREATGSSMGLVDLAGTLSEASPGGRILLIEDRPDVAGLFSGALGQNNELIHVERFEEALTRARARDFDLVIVSLGLRGFDGLRLCSQLRSLPEVRNVPILVLVSEGDTRKLNQALEMGVNDYLTRPVDRNELVARVRTQLRKKRFSDRLRQNVHLSVEMAMTDQLTGLHNRHYMTRHLETLLAGLTTSGKTLAFLIMDIDHFKRVNDTYGHDVGDEILRQFAQRISANVRGIDLACRFGGEEFVIIMPDSDIDMACGVAERLRASVENTPFSVSRPPGTLNITVSIGIAGAEGMHDSTAALLRRADQALYRAKRMGRNRVVADAA